MLTRCGDDLALRILFLLWALATAPQVAAEVIVKEVEAKVEGAMLVMDTNIDYGFSDAALEALDNGVPLTLLVHVQLRGADDWVWTPSLADVQLRYVIRYKPLSERYQVSQLPDKGGVDYVTRDAAIAALGEVEGLQLISKKRLADEDGPFEIQVKASLDIEELPLPLKPIAYLFPSWKLSSGWTKWPLEF
jgi:hypothetical protein